MSEAATGSARVAPREQRVHLIQGEFRVSALPQVVLTTTLGSCVATCMRDPVARVGGMNHFLLPDGGEREGPDAHRYGAYAMELLINGLLHQGARRDRLEAKVFGGGRLSERLPDIGGKNAMFAEEFLGYEGITFLGGSVRGCHARRLQFWPVSGRVRQLFVTGGERVFETERERVAPAVAGAVELF